MHGLDLSSLDWYWRGWRPWSWKLFSSVETGQQLRCDLGPLPATVPGTVQKALLDAGLLEDWYVGMNSLGAEWVEHRHWELTARLPGGELAGARRLRLAAEGLDYSGWVLVDGREVGTFSGVLKPQRFDLTEYLADGRDHYLTIIFDEPPPEQGQIGFTSRSRYFKPRHNYGWDWCPRFVPIGVWGALALQRDLEAEVEVVKVWSDLAEDLTTGSLRITLLYDPAGEAEDLTARARVYDEGAEVARHEGPLAPGQHELALDGLAVEPWWPNSEGRQKTYLLAVEVLDTQGEVAWRDQRKVGFKRVRWLPCEGAPEGALPWLCEVNGRPVFLQGVNWSPIRVNHADLAPADYRERIDLYREMGCNLFRVWGGAYLETEGFYDLCDEAGILVWQEFPLSSSGVENWPPEDPEVIQELVRIARSYIHRRAHHVSLLMWCGGNELLGGPEGSKIGSSVPAPPDHPCLAALRDVVREEDPTRRFQHTSPSGPRAHGGPAEWGQGVHHEVHGPWGFDGNMEAYKEYWRGDDALFRAEVGVPGACDVELIKRYCPDAWWPPNNPTWAHSCLWWIGWGRFSNLGDLPPEEGLAAYVRQTQAEQAEGLGFAAEACKRRFPRCGGFLIWHGHDCFPCPINNSVIDFEGRPKPGYFALQRVFTNRYSG